MHARGLSTLIIYMIEIVFFPARMRSYTAIESNSPNYSEQQSVSDVKNGGNFTVEIDGNITYQDLRISTERWRRYLIVVFFPHFLIFN